MICSIILTKEENFVVATDSTTGIASQGKTEEEAIFNIKEALELYYEDIPEEQRVSVPTSLISLEVAV